MSTIEKLPLVHYRINLRSWLSPVVIRSYSRALFPYRFLYITPITRWNMIRPKHFRGVLLRSKN